MKKILYTIGFLLFFSSLVKPLAVFGEDSKSQYSGDEKDVPFSTARIFSSVLEKTGLQPSSDLGVTFGTDKEEDVGKDLYLTIYKKTQEEPEKQAFKNTAGKYGITEADMVRLSQGDYTPIVEKKKGLSQEEAQNKMAQIQQSLSEESDLLTLHADIKAAVETNEIFANGDTGDSGFDLIKDLQNIEKILFMKADPIDIGGSFGGGDGGGAAPQIPAGGPNAPEKNKVLNGNAVPNAANDQKGPGGANAGKGLPNGGLAGGGGGANGADVLQDGQIDPNKCLSENSLDKALADFAGKAKADPNLKDLSGVKLNSDFPNVGGGNAGGAAGGNNDSSVPQVDSGDFMPEKQSPAAAPVQPAPADQWQKPKDCDGVFCLKVEYIKKPATSAFSSSDNCIACMVEKSNDTLKKVINHSLIPGKAPGNLGESAVCKKAVGDLFGSVSMNFYAITMPVKTPTNDDLVFGTNAIDDWYNFCKTVSLYPFNECKKPAKTVEESKYEITPSVTDTIAQKELSTAADNVSQEDIAKKIDTAVQSYKIESAKNALTYETTKAAEKKIVMYHPLLTEMDLMNFYFVNFSKILQSLHEDVTGVAGTRACTVLKNKKTCS